MNNARMAVGLQGVSIAERSYQMAVNYSKERIQGTEMGVKGGPKVPIIKHADVRRMLMMMRAYTEAGRALCYTAAALADGAEHTPDAGMRAQFQSIMELLIPVVKAWCSDFGVDVASLAIQVYGGMGYIEESGVPQMIRDAQIAPVYEGTNGIQALDLCGRKVAMERGMPMFALTKQIKDTVKQLSEVTDDDDCLAIADTLGKVTRMLEDCTKWMLVAFGGGNMHLASASSVAYLHLTGVVVGGWLMGKAALISKEKLRKGEGNLSFYKAKITTARFYNDYILSQGFGYAHAISKGGYSALELTDEQF